MSHSWRQRSLGPCAQFERRSVQSSSWKGRTGKNPDSGRLGGGQGSDDSYRLPFAQMPLPFRGVSILLLPGAPVKDPGGSGSS